MPVSTRSQTSINNAIASNSTTLTTVGSPSKLSAAAAAAAAAAADFPTKVSNRTWFNNMCRRIPDPQSALTRLLFGSKPAWEVHIPGTDPVNVVTTCDNYSDHWWCTACKTSNNCKHINIISMFTLDRTITRETMKLRDLHNQYHEYMQYHQANT